MDNYLVMTYYQLMSAIALRMYNRKKSRLFVLKDYLNIDDKLKEKIEATNLFDEVVFFSESYYIHLMYAELELLKKPTPSDIKTSLYKNLDPLYSEVFKNCKRDERLYLFNEMQHYYYYVENLFDTIVKVEDGYNSFAQELNIHRFSGKRELLYKIVGDGYPVIKSKSPKIKKIIVSEPIPDLEKSYQDLIEVLNIRALFSTPELGFDKVILKVFSLDQIHFEEKSVLILTQPLARADYCKYREQYVLYEKICKKYYKDYRVYLKPHPADMVPYDNLDEYGVSILDKELPLEILNYTEAVFDYGITFGSTGISNMRFIKEKVILHDAPHFTVQDVRNKIKELIKSERMVVSYLIVLSKEKKSALLKTLKSLPKEKSAEVLVIGSESEWKSYQSHLELENKHYFKKIVCKEHLSLIEKRKIVFEKSTGNYVLFLDVGFFLDAGLHSTLLFDLSRAVCDLVDVDLTFYYNGEKFSRYRAEDISVWARIYFFQNLVINRSVLKRCAFDEFLGYADLKLYVDIIANSSERVTLKKGGISYTVDKPLFKRSPIDYLFESQLEIFKEFKELNDSVGSHKYDKWLIGFVFQYMYYSNLKRISWDRYKDFLNMDEIIDFKLSNSDTLLELSQFRIPEEKLAKVFRKENIKIKSKRIVRETLKGKPLTFANAVYKKLKK